MVFHSKKEWVSLVIKILKRLAPSRILALGFAGIIVLGTFLLTLPVSSQTGEPLKFLDALFTATSAVCVTGLVVVDTGSFFSNFGQTVILCLIQIGGLGFMTMSTLLAMFLGKKIGLKERILIQESLNQTTLSGVVRLIRKVILVTLIVELLGGLILSLRFLTDFPVEKAFAFGFFHAISAFCNAGFDLFGQVFGAFTGMTHYVEDWTVCLTIGGLVVLGGLGFPVIVELLNFLQKRRLSLHTKLVLLTTIFLIVTGAVLVFIFEAKNGATLQYLSLPGKIIASFFQSIMTRTAGFSSLEIGNLHMGTWFIMILLMFVGASPSSTGGGIKTTTFGVIAATVSAAIKGHQDVELFRKRIPKDIIYKAITIMSVSLAWISVVTLMLSLIEKQDFIRLFFEVMSAFGTIGLSTGITTSLTGFSELLIIITMFIGRVGPVTIMVALSKKERKNSVRYIEERIMIG